MCSIWDVPFIVTDVETSGSDPDKNRIIEISCITVQSGEILSEYSSLVNPHQYIPEFIAKMTGIKNEIAFSAPESRDVFPNVSKIMSQEGAVFVGHNAKFDWSFVKRSLQRETLPAPELQKICTLKLARRLLEPSLKKNLASVSNFFNITIKNRHRASGDAIATAKVLVELLEIAESEFDIHTLTDLINFQDRPLKQTSAKIKNLELIKPKLEILPNEPGVYYFKDNKDNILYVGKAKNLRSRVNSYFKNDFFRTKKISRLLKNINDVQWTCTDTELAAMILESKEIKAIQPPYNTMDKTYLNYPFIKITGYELFPRLELTHTIDDSSAEYFGPFRSTFLVQRTIENINKLFKLRKCEKEITDKPHGKPCFYHQIDKCYSPCSKKNIQDKYDLEIEKVKYYLSNFSNSIIDNLEEKMKELSNDMQFEKATLVRNNIIELRKVLERQELVPTSINKNNMILILPASSRAKTVEIFFIKTGKLIHQETIGKRQPLDNFDYLIHDTYFNNNFSPFVFDHDDINELKIITSYTHRNKENGEFIYIDGKAEENVINDFASKIRNISYPDFEEIEINNIEINQTIDEEPEFSESLD